MIPYDWTCHVCRSVNAAGSDRCAACGCAAVSSRAGLERQLTELKRCNPAAELPPQATGPQLLLGMLATLALIAGMLLVLFSEETLTGFVVGFVGYLLAKLAGRLGQRKPADASDVQD